MKPVATFVIGLFLLSSPAVADSEVAGPSGDEASVTLEHRHDHSHIGLFRRHHDGERTCTRLLSVPLFSLYRSERSGDQRDLRVLSLPIIGSLYRHRMDGQHHRREFLYLIDIESES